MRTSMINEFFENLNELEQSDRIALSKFNLLGEGPTPQSAKVLSMVMPEEDVTDEEFPIWQAVGSWWAKQATRQDGECLTLPEVVRAMKESSPQGTIVKRFAGVYSNSLEPDVYTLRNLDKVLRLVWQDGEYTVDMKRLLEDLLVWNDNDDTYPTIPMIWAKTAMQARE